MSRHPLRRLFALSFAFSLPLLACGEDNAAPSSDEQKTGPTDTQTEDELSNADQLTSGDTASACEPSACPASTVGGTPCCTSADDISATRAVTADQCGLDMSQFGYPGCTQRDQPGVLDQACPPVPFFPEAPPMPGCCTPTGHCGGMETFVGFGCTSSPDTSSWISCG